MYLKIVLTALIVGFLLPFALDVEAVFTRVERQFSLALAANSDPARVPVSLKKDGSLNAVTPDEWRSGFFPGSLWYLYERSKNERWKTAAERYTQLLEKEQFNRTTHDLGFMLFCSYGNGYRLTQNPQYKTALLNGAASLASRFNPKVGCLKSWDWTGPEKKWQFPVIVDNMMNLELLFWASRASGDSRFRDIAVSHARTTMKNHFRPDASSMHVVDYDSLTGAVRSRETHQGYAGESLWARGQSWGLYGFTMVYRETKAHEFLAFARRIADRLIQDPHLPVDRVPYWDYNAPNIPNEPRDASAATLMASALLELSRFGGKNGPIYFKTAEKILTSLASPAYFAPEGHNGNFVLMHSVGGKPFNAEVDAPQSFTDYYFLEALTRYQALKK